MRHSEKPFYDLKPGQTLGRNYYVIEYLGGGWEGEVYKVEERETGIIRAAKIFYPRYRRGGTPAQRYARKLFSLRRCPVVIQYAHRDIARVGRDSVEILVADFADGETLSSYLQKQPGHRLREFEALHLIHALAVGMEQIHYLGEYHGDIQTDNVIVRRYGLGFNVQLIDFFDFGKRRPDMIQYDVYDMLGLLHDIIGGAKYYRTASPETKSLIMGRKRTLIRQRFRNAGDLRLALDNLEWG